MIITATEVQNILDITGQEEKIEQLIPFAESYAFGFTKNYFHQTSFFTHAYFHNDKLEIDELGFSLQNNFYLHIQNSILNNGLFQIKSIAGTVLTLDRSVYFELNNKVKISICQFPEGYKISLAKFIGSLLSGSGTTTEKTSEKIGDYSYTLASASDVVSDYFSPYKKIVVV